MYKSLYLVLCFAYKTVIRPILLKAIDDPNSDWDDITMDVIDSIFNYK